MNSDGRRTLPPDFKALYRDVCASSDVVILPLGQNVCHDGVLVVDEKVGLNCSASFEGLRRCGLNPYVDYNHQEDVLAGDVSDVYFCPRRGVCAVVDWRDWAEQEIINGSCDSFSPRYFIDERGELEGLTQNLGALLHRTMTAGIPRLQASLKPVSKLEDFVFRASHFRRLLNGLQRSGMADAQSVLAQRMPRSHAAATRYSEMESEFGLKFYLNHS